MKCIRNSLYIWLAWCCWIELGKESFRYMYCHEVRYGSVRGNFCEKESGAGVDLKKRGRAQRLPRRGRAKRAPMYL